jgi:hypothetical protein
VPYSKISGEQLEALVRDINALLPGHKVEWAYGRPRLFRTITVDTQHGPAGGLLEVSPRLPRKCLVEWMDGYLKGLREGYAGGEAAGSQKGWDEAWKVAEENPGDCDQ